MCAARPDSGLALRMRMEQPNRFQKLVAEAKKSISEISPNDTALELGRGDATLIDVRSDEDWKAGHACGAKHLTRGEVEVEIEEQVPDLDQRIICYCGGGSRSALVAESLQKMGYRNVRSMTGGFRGWKTAGLPTAE
jgi:rhodanese-related sulfurtransferase